MYIYNVLIIDHNDYNNKVLYNYSTYEQAYNSIKTYFSNIEFGEEYFNNLIKYTYCDYFDVRTNKNYNVSLIKTML